MEVSPSFTTPGDEELQELVITITKDFLLIYNKLPFFFHVLTGTLYIIVISINRLIDIAIFQEKTFPTN